jgi:putative nucleotidyltransferase with HDIG domain
LLLPMALSHGFPANDEHGTRSVRFLISLVKGAMPNLEFILMEIAKPRDTLRRWVERASAVARARALVGEAVASIASALEAKDPYTAGHQRRVASLAVAIARTLGLGDDSVEAVRVAGLVHDIGKIGLLSELLCKPGKLMEAELALLRTHAAIGARILGHIDFGAPIARIVHQRHERLDGSGYPKGLEGDEILLEARIIAVADAVEAIASDRPYRPAMVLGAALYHIVDGRCVLFEGGAVDACIVVLARPEAPPEGWRT